MGGDLGEITHLLNHMPALLIPQLGVLDVEALDVSRQPFELSGHDLRHRLR